MKLRTWRRIHRYLGLVIGLQLFLWTLSGAYFSWNSIRSVRGEDFIREPEDIDLRKFQLINCDEVLAKLPPEHSAESVILRTMLDRPVYEVVSFSDREKSALVFDAETGTQISPIPADMAAEIAQRDFAVDVDVRSIERITSVGSHAEYRGKELPAYRVELDHPSGVAIYVSEQRGTVTARRNSTWRVFDFFWMLHTMDYQGRDNFNQWLLKTISIFGMVTVLSGFGLWMKTSRLFRKKRKSSGPKRTVDDRGVSV